MPAFADIRDPLVGALIDNRYLVRGVLGRGGMGVVYEGVHEQLGRSVAIKVLGAGIAGDPTAVQRFLREARTASQLTHGNIVDVSDLGQLPDGRPYLVMPKMQGMDLATMLSKHGPQTPQRTAELLRGAAAALDLIHAKGYVHRDVKPENLMHVVREDGSEAVLLLDFGIVGLVSNAGARLTADGSVFGTPAYLPPEVIQGDPPDPRSDVYALATVAFELIIGRTPFFGPNPLKLLPQKIMKDAPTMEEVSGFEFPVAIENALARGLAREPAQRYASAGAFVAALTIAAQRHPTAGGRALPPPPADENDALAMERAARHAAVAGANQGAGNAEAPAAIGGGLNAVDSGVTDIIEDAGRYAPDARDGLAPDARARLLESATGELEMSIGLSAPPVQAGPTENIPLREAEAKARQAPTFLLALPGRRRTALWVAIGVSIIVALSIWLVLPHDSESKIVAKELPAPPVPAAPVIVVPDEPATSPEPAIAPPSQAPPPPKAAEPVRAKRNPAREPAPAKAAVPAPNAMELGKAAQHELIQGHLAAAAELYAQATRVDPRNEPAWRGLGLAYERLGRTADAVRALRKAIQLAPSGQNADMMRARLQKLTGAP